MTRPIELVLSRLKAPRKSGAGWKASCPVTDAHKHGDRHPSLSIKEGNDGTVLLKCQASTGCTVALICGAMGLELKDLFPATPGARPKKYAKQQKQTRAMPAAPAVPRRDPAELARDGEQAAAFAMDLQHAPDVLAYLWKRRGISAETALAWSLGMKDVRRGRQGVIVSVTWTLQIVDAARHLLGVKLHRDPPLNGQPKGGWLTKGGAGLFPAPEAQSLQPGDELIITPGELKALRYVDAGLKATSPTTGEATALTTWEIYADRLRGLRVVIDHDREDTQVSKGFVHNAIRALRGKALKIEVMA